MFVISPSWRIIILEGIPEIGISNIVDQIKLVVENCVIWDLSKTVVTQNQPKKFLENTLNLENFMEQNIGKPIIILNPTVPERLLNPTPQRLEELCNLEKQLSTKYGHQVCYAFFIKGSVGYFDRAIGNLNQAIVAFQKQEQWLKAYGLCSYNKRFNLSADGLTYQDLANTIFFQSEYPLIRIKYPNPDDFWD